MKFNIFSLGDQIADPVTGLRRDARQRHRGLVDMAVRAEAAGFSGVNVGEHHGLEYNVSAPPVLLAAIGERTTRLRLGTAVTLLANLDALRIAPEKPWHLTENIKHLCQIHKFGTASETRVRMVSELPCVASSASMGMTRQQISPTSACTRFSTGARSPRDWRL